MLQIAFAVLSALHYLYTELKVIHRDVKPSNILINRKGDVKMCDFGISGYLVNSVAKTIDAGCKPYMAPERIDPQSGGQYDIRSDVWSFGISMIEMATGNFPYDTWKTPFEQLKQVRDTLSIRVERSLNSFLLFQVVTDAPPTLRNNSSGAVFTESFMDFIDSCLQKNCKDRSNYEQLLNSPFILEHISKNTDIASYITEILDDSNVV